MEYSVVSGYDPLVVTFYDQSQSRSFPIGSWKYDFGDDLIYGALPDERVSDASANFILPGDVVVSDRLESSTKRCLTGVGEVLNRSTLMNPVMASSYRTVSTNTIHYTGVNFISGDSSENGDVFKTLPPARVQQIAGGENSIVLAGMTPIADDCNRNNCGYDLNAGSDVSHIYKGAGVYLATLACSSVNGVEGWELSSSNFSGIGENLAYCLVTVFPTCPCISVDVYGTGNNASEFVTITSSAFTCDDMSTFDSCTGYCNPFSISGLNGFTGVSGYAPFLKIAASGLIMPRSLPITGSIWNWSDWYSDYVPSDQQEHGPIVSGWPVWETTNDWDAENKCITADSEHVYVMPGVYSVGLYPQFDMERISAVIQGVPFEQCLEESERNGRATSANCVMLRELPPRGGEIVWDTIDPEQYPTVVSGISVVGLSSGSFPIARLDWDFGDGSEIVTISRYLSGSYDGILSESTTGMWVYTSADANYWIGVEGVSYDERDPRNMNFNHKYERTELLSYPDGYIVSLTAFASNTDTSFVLTASLPSAALPKFSDIEGDITLIDSKLERDDSSMFMFESKNEGQIFTLRTN